MPAHPEQSTQVMFTMRFKLLSSAALAVAVAACAAVATPLATDDSPAYHLLAPLKLGAATRWDYTAIDSTHHRLFLTRGDHVDVLALPSGQPVGTVAHTAGVHGVAFAADLGLGFTSNGKSNSVTVFDLDTLQVKAELAVAGQRPDAIVYEPSVHRLYVFDGGSDSVDVIDAKTLKPVTSLQASGTPEFAAADGHGRIYFNIEDHPGLDVIDVASDRIVARWKLAGCEGPTGLAIDAQHRRVISTCRNGVAVVSDATSGARVAQFAIGSHPDAAVFDADRRTVLVPGGGDRGGEGTLTVVSERSPDHYRVRQTLATAQGARALAFDPQDHHVYLPTAISHEFVVLRAAPVRPAS